MKHTYFLRSALAIAMLSALTFLNACSDDETSPEEKNVALTPLKEYLGTKELTIDVQDYDYLWSLGYEFEVKRDGTITELGCAVPVAGEYILELYDSETEERLGQASVSFTEEEVEADPFAWKYKQLTTAVAVTEGKKYRVTYSLPEGSDQFYRVDPQDGFELPVLSDDSSIEIIQGVYGEVEEFPYELWDEVVYLADVKFEYKSL